jgi:hypothetical protein
MGGKSIERCSWNKVTPLASASGDKSFRIVRTMAPLANVIFFAGDAAACDVAAFPALACNEDRRPSPAPVPSQPIASLRFIPSERRLRMRMPSELHPRGDFRQTSNERRSRREPRRSVARVHCERRPRVERVEEVDDPRPASAPRRCSGCWAATRGSRAG